MVGPPGMTLAYYNRELCNNFLGFVSQNPPSPFPPFPGSMGYRRMLRSLLGPQGLLAPLPWPTWGLHSFWASIPTLQ